MAKLEEYDGRKNEKVGKVVLDYSAYCGKDFYCDGAVEDDLLDIAKSCSDVEFPGIIEERASWPIFYHLSAARENIVRWLPIKKTDKVLEVGSGCGAITGAFTKLAGEVVSCDLSRKRSMINAQRHFDCDNLKIHVGNFTDVEKNLPTDFDYICLIGVFEYGQSYIDSDTPFEDFLNILRKHLKKNGRIVIAIENRLGMKYLSGCKEDHVSRYFAGIEGYEQGDGVRTFSKAGLKKVFNACGEKDYHFYYPYPDYKFMTTLFSDKRLPSVGELINNTRNFDQDRMQLFDEKKAFDAMVKDGIFDEYSNSYLVILGPDVNVEYARFSNDRAEEYQIYTSLEVVDGKKQIVKHPLSELSYEHIKKLSESYEKLTKRYEGGKLKINRCELKGAESEAAANDLKGAKSEVTANDLKGNEGEPAACFEFVNGKTLSELMDEKIAKDDMDGFYALFDEYVSRVGYGNDSSVGNQDVVFSNILVDGDEWTLIDYEWIKDRPIDISETAYRAFYCYLLEDKNRAKINRDLILKKITLPEEAAAIIERDEAVFQKRITGKHLSQAEIRNLLGRKIIDPAKLLANFEDHGGAYRFQVYPADAQGGFSEETSYFVRDAYNGESEASVSIPIKRNDVAIRLDPLCEACIVTVTEAFIDGNPYPVSNKKYLLCNGRRIGEDSFVFPTEDPNLIFLLEGLVKTNESFLDVKMNIVRLKNDIAVKVFDNIKRIF